MAKTLSELIEEREAAGSAASEQYEEESYKKNGSGIKTVSDILAEMNHTPGEKIDKFGEGADYLGTRLVDGLVSNIEGFVDFGVGGISYLIGLAGSKRAENYSKKVFSNDWYNYNRANEKYDPGKGMKVVGDITGVIGGAIPDVIVGIATGGLGWGAKAISLGTSFTSAAGRGINEAVNTTGELGGKEWAGGVGAGALAAGIEAASGGLGNVAGGWFGKTGVEMGGEIAESFGKKTSKETVSSVLSKSYAKESASELGESAFGKAIKNIWNSKSGRELIGEVLSEGGEEALETYLEPYIKQNTYDPSAPDASFGDVLYSALLGGVAGGAMSAGKSAIQNTNYAVTGAKITNSDSKLQSLISKAQIISNYESNYNTGSIVFEAVQNLYSKVKEHIATSEGKYTASQLKDIGQLNALVGSSMLQPAAVKAAGDIARNADSVAAMVNAYNQKVGGPTVTAEQITAGLKLDSDNKAFNRSVTSALQTNGVLRELVLNSMISRAEFDAREYAASIFDGVKISDVATQENINRFIASADKQTLKQLGEALGITNWATLTPDELAQKLRAFRDSGASKAYEGVIKAIQKAKGTEGYTNGLPSSVRTLTESVTRFKSDGVDIAIIKEGGGYRLYDFETNHVTRVMSEAEMDALIKQIRDKQISFKEQSEMQKLDKELHDFALKEIPEYKKLTTAEREAVRETLRRARAYGASKADQILFGRISAKSGMAIHLTDKVPGGDVAFFDGKNTIYLDANAPRTRSYKGLLGHEVWHKMFKSSRIADLFNSALDNIDPGKRAEVKEMYTQHLRELGGRTEAEIENVSEEEVAAAYAEELFNNPHIWDIVLDGEPTLKDKVLAFFKLAPKRYSFAPEMEPAAKEWIREYKKLFDEISAENRSDSAVKVIGRITEAGESQSVRVIGRVTEDNVTTTDGSYTAENADSDAATTTNQQKMQDSGRSAILNIFNNMSNDEQNSGEEVADFIDGVNSMLDESKKNKRKKKIGVLSEKHVDTINNLVRKINPDFSAEGYELWIDGIGAQHIERRHGIKGEADNTMASREEKALIPWAAQNADSGDFIKDNDGNVRLSTRFFNSDGSRAPEVRLEKHTSEGTVYISECVPDSLNKRIWITSAYRNKKSSKGQLLNIEDTSSPQPTPEASFDSNATTNSILDPNEKINSSDKNSSKNVDSGGRSALADSGRIDTARDFFVNGEEFSTPTISEVGKERMHYKGGVKDWLYTKKTSAYIHGVDEMYGIQSYLEKVGGAKNAKFVIQQVRAAPHQVQSMIGSVQYNVFESNKKKARKLGDGLSEIFKPIEKQGASVMREFNDYLLHHLNVDKYDAYTKMKNAQESDLIDLHKVQERIDALSEQTKLFEDEIFNLGNVGKDVIRKKKLNSDINRNQEMITKLKGEEEFLLTKTATYAEEELLKLNAKRAELTREINKMRRKIFEAGNAPADMKKKSEFKDKISDMRKELEHIEERAKKFEEIINLYNISLKPVFYLKGETVTKEESERYISKYNISHPEFAEIAQKVWNFNDNLNRMRVSAGLISESVRERMNTMYPHYVPAFRSKVDNSANKDTGVKVSSTVKRAKGYNHDIMDVKESISSQVSQVLKNGNVNVLANKVYDTAAKSGDARYVDIGLPDADGGIISTEGADRPKPHTITFFRNGAEYSMNVSEEIFLGFKGIREASASYNNVFARVTAWVTKQYKELVTSKSPAFLIRNAIRDMQDAGLNSKHPLKFARNVPVAWKMIAENSEEWQTYRAYGGFSSTVFDSKGVKGAVGKRGFEALEIAEKLAKKQKLSVKDVKYLKDIGTAVENVNAVVEQIPRFAEYLSSIQSGESIEQAIYNSAEVTTNFARRGATTKAFNATIVPFLNPAVQGFDKIFRNFGDAFEKESAKEVVLALAQLLIKALAIGMLPMLFNSLAYKDDEDYKNLRETDKENNYLIKLPNGTFLKLPRGRVASVIAGLANRGAKAIRGEDVDWKGYIDNVISQVTPVENLTRTISSPFMDVANNLTWYGTAIEGPEFDNVQPKDRYDESTSSIAIAIGKVINYSPKKIHYLIDQYSGVIGDFLLPATTLKAEKDFFSGNFTLDPVTSNKISDNFYKIYDEVRYAKSEGDINAQYQLRYLNRVKSSVSELYDEISAIHKSDLSGIEKLQQVRVLRIMINEAMKNATADFDLISKAINETAGLGYDDSNTSQVNERYAEIIRRVYGAERALEEYNKDVYAKYEPLIRSGMDSEIIYESYFAIKGVQSDKDENGETVDGSKRKKVIEAIMGLGASDEEKLLLIGMNGYVLSSGDITGMSSYEAKDALYDYIERLDGITDEERAELYKACGFDGKDDGILPGTSDFEYELDQGDKEDAKEIFGLIISDRMGSKLGSDSIDELIRLGVISDLYLDRIMPSAIADKLTVNGKERDLTAEEISSVKEKYGEAGKQIDSFIGSELYKSYTDEQKSAAIAKIYDLYKNIAYDSTLGTEKDADGLLLSKIVDGEVLCAFASLGVITSDKDSSGETISGSKRKKVIDAINGLDISDNEKILLIALKGYALKDDDIPGATSYQAKMALYNYIGTLDLTAEEKFELYNGCGFDVVDGEAQRPTQSTSGSSGGSSGSGKTRSGNVSLSSGGILTNRSGSLASSSKKKLVRGIGKIIFK